MAFQTHTFAGRIPTPDHDKSTWAKKIEDTTSKIIALFDARTPIFTKNDLQQVYMQLKKPLTKGETISIRGVDGVSVDFEIETGSIYPNDHDTEFIIGAPIIYYCSIQTLTVVSARYWNPRVAYCSLRIHHYKHLRSKITGEFLGIPPKKSRTEAMEFFEAIRQEWEESKSCKLLRLKLGSAPISIPIRKIIAFACGAFSLDHVYDEEIMAFRSASQHALLLTSRDILQGKDYSADAIICLAQDPAYTDVDEFVLGKHEIIKVPDPKGFLEVDDSTIVISICADIPVRQIVSDLTQPAVLIWDRVRYDDSSEFKTDPESSRICAMTSTFYDELDIQLEKRRFGDIGVYVRRTS